MKNNKSLEYLFAPLGFLFLYRLGGKGSRCELVVVDLLLLAFEPA